MTNTDKDFIKKWEKTRAEGRFRFALLRGPLAGFITALLLGFLQMGDRSFTEVLFSQELLFNIILFVITFFLIQYILMWEVNQYLYKRKLAKG